MKRHLMRACAYAVIIMFDYESLGEVVPRQYDGNAGELDRVSPSGASRGLAGSAERLRGG